MEASSAVPSKTDFDNDQLRIAQEAINTPEVQQMLKRLGDFNLGIYMPHMHTDEIDFLPLPVDTVQIERDLAVSFEKMDAAFSSKSDGAVPVSWRWVGQGAQASGTCGTFCIPRSGGGGHINRHRQGY